MQGMHDDILSEATRSLDAMLNFKTTIRKAIALIETILNKS